MTSQELLDEKRAKRAEAEKALEAARAALDEGAMVEARQLLAALDEIIATLEVKAAAEREADAKQQATKRLIGIRKAHGSIVNEMDRDEERVRSLHDELTAAVQRLNERYQTALAFEAEAAALIDRFEIDAELPPAPPAPGARNIPEPLPALLDVAFVGSPATEEHAEMDWRRRRTYAEVRGTPGYEIIAKVGPKPWRQLNEQEQHVLAVRRQRAERDARAGEKLGAPLTLPNGTAIGTI